MRLGHAMFLGLMAALLSLAAPTLARNSNQPKPSEVPASSSCRAYQQGSGRHMETIAMSGNGFQAGGAAEIGVEERGRGRVTESPVRPIPEEQQFAND